EEAEVLVKDPHGHPDPSWKMRHSMLKEVAYASLPKRERRRLHRLVAAQVAAAGFPTSAADHLYLAALASIDLDPNDRSAPNEAADALLKSGDRARRRMESMSAVDRYRRALTMCGAEEGWGVREARVLAGLGEASYWLGDYPGALEVLKRAVALGEVQDDPFALAMALRFLGDIAINYEGEVEKIWRRALELSDPEDAWARVRSLTALSINRTEMHDMEGALKLIEEAGKLAEECGDQFSVANTYVQKARVFDDLGRREEAVP